MKVILVSGGFDPLHSGHISYLNSAKELGDKLIVALNSDNWLVKKKGKFLLPFEERKLIIKSLKMVDEVIDFVDDEKGTCMNALKKVKKLYPKDKITFCNGGDRTNDNIPEKKISGVDFAFEVGGNYKKNSSSSILKDYSYSSEDRIWGKFFNLYTEKNIKIKELIINPNKGISYQRHFKRSELWFVKKGECVFKKSINNENPKKYTKSVLKEEDIVVVKKGSWHQIYNTNNRPCHIIEIQYGDYLDEKDIDRLSFYSQNEL